jgi:hypothetical protein
LNQKIERVEVFAIAMARVVECIKTRNIASAPQLGFGVILGD